MHTPEKRSSEELIQDILNWHSHSDLLTLEQHITEEFSKLTRKTAKSPSFKEQYQLRSGELVTTLTSKLESYQYLLHKWRGGDFTITPEDKTVISDMLEFVANPFSRFTNSASKSLGNVGRFGFLNVLQGVESTAIQTSKTLSNNSEAYDGLRSLLVELCDNIDYPIPENVKHGQPRNDLGIG